MQPLSNSYELLTTPRCHNNFMTISQMIQELSRYLKWFKCYCDISNDSSVIAISQMIQELSRYLKWFKSYRDISWYLKWFKSYRDISWYLKWFKSYRDISNDSRVIAISEMIQVLSRYLKWFKCYCDISNDSRVIVLTDTNRQTDTTENNTTAARLSLCRW